MKKGEVDSNIKNTNSAQRIQFIGMIAFVLAFHNRI